MSIEIMREEGITREYLPYLPFTHSAKTYIKSHPKPLNDLLDEDKIEYHPFVARAIERINESLVGDITKPIIDKETKWEEEFYSYPLTRIFLSYMGDRYLISRYAIKEAKACVDWLRELYTKKGVVKTGGDDSFENSVKRVRNLIASVAADLGIEVMQAKEDVRGYDFELHFSDYIMLSTLLRDVHWKLVNRPMQGGKVMLAAKDLLRLIEEPIRVGVLEGLPHKLSDDVVSLIKKNTKIMRGLNEISQKLESMQGHYEMGRGKQSDFPPCMQDAMRLISENVNLPHTLRFALTSFLLNVGWDVDEVVNLFQNSPDFNHKLATYQVSHIAGSSGTVYTPPSCKTMKTYGNCPGGDRYCINISHPLAYYRKVRRLKQRGDNTKNDTTFNKD